MDTALLEKLAACSSPDEVQAALKEAGMKLAPEGGAPAKDKPPGDKAPSFGKPKDEGAKPPPFGGPPAEDKPKESYSELRDSALKGAAKKHGMEF